MPRINVNVRVKYITIMGTEFVEKDSEQLSGWAQKLAEILLVLAISNVNFESNLMNSSVVKVV